MTRAKKGAARLRAKKRILKAAKGNFMGRRKLYRTVMENLDRAQVYAFRDRRRRKRDFRGLWITRINAACHQRELRYSQLISGLKAANVEVDRKMLADLAIADPAAFDRLVAMAKEKIGA